MPTSKRFLVTGSRTWSDFGTIYTAISAFTTPGDTLVVGDARGVDDAARRFWADRGPVEVFEITREQWRTLGRAAGPRRNRLMVDSGADLCLAFIDLCRECVLARPHGTHGASHCARLAAEAGIPVHGFGPGAPQQGART